MTRVVVVGGGATGAGVVRDLALRGVDATLVEREDLAAGTTGRSHALLHSGARYADTDPAGARACAEENRVLRRIAGRCVEPTGGYLLSLPGDDAGYVDEKLAACRDCGVPATPADAETVLEREPGVTDDVERAVRVPDAVVRPALLTAATAADARARGARLLTDHAVTDVRVEGGRATGVVVERDDRREVLAADHVVNAAGPWAGRVAALAGVDVPMRPTRGVMVDVDVAGLSSVLNRCRPPADGDVVVPRGDGAVLGTTSVPVADPDDPGGDEREVETVREECAAMLPAAAAAPARTTYRGVRPLYAPDERERGDERAISRDFALLDHADRDGLGGLTTIVGGKLTTHRLMAEATADAVCAALGVGAACRTARLPLRAADDRERLRALAAALAGDAPADPLDE